MDALQRIVDTNDKKRYELLEEGTGVWYIRAAQGHTMKTIDDSLLLTPITDAATIPVAVHGTYMKFWESIKVGATALLSLLFLPFQLLCAGPRHLNRLAFCNS